MPIAALLSTPFRNSQKRTPARRSEMSSRAGIIVRRETHPIPYRPRYVKSSYAICTDLSRETWSKPALRSETQRMRKQARLIRRGPAASYLFESPISQMKANSRLKGRHRSTGRHRSQYKESPPTQ